MYIADAYRVFDKSYPYIQIETFNFCLSTVVSLIDNILIINAFQRLQKYLGH